MDLLVNLSLPAKHGIRVRFYIASIHLYTVDASRQAHTT